MLGQQIMGAAKYKAEDLPKDSDGNVIVATFISDAKKHKFHLIEKDYTLTANGETHPKKDSGLRLEFNDYRINVSSKALLKVMLEARQFNQHRGFRIDPSDPSGFWRKNGTIEEKEIKTAALDTIKPVSYKDIQFKKIAESKEKHEPLRIL